MWLLNKVKALNILAQYLQVSFMLMWMPWWVLSSWACEKNFEHGLHEKGFSPVCVLVWCVRPADLLKVLSHSLHWKGILGLCTFYVYSNVKTVKSQFWKIANFLPFYPLHEAKISNQFPLMKTLTEIFNIFVTFLNIKRQQHAVMLTLTHATLSPSLWLAH